MTSMKIAQFSRPPTPLLIYVQNSSTSLDAQFKTNPRSVKRKHNLKMTIISDQVLPLGRLSFSVSTHFVCLSLNSFHLAEVSLSYVALYSCVCSCRKLSLYYTKTIKCLLFIIIQIFSTHFTIYNYGTTTVPCMWTNNIGKKKEKKKQKQVTANIKWPRVQFRPQTMKWCP